MESESPGQAHSVASFYSKHLWLPLAVSLPVLFLLEVTGIDHTISGWFFDRATMRFPLRYSPIFERVTHNWPTHGLVLLACAVLGAWLMSYLFRARRAYRQVLGFLFLALTVAPGGVGLLKAHSHRSCPWDLVEYGGTAPFVGLFDTPPPGHYPGKCFPSGHASRGFCLFAFYFAGLALGRRKLALAGLWGGTTVGFLLGWTRLMQGGHFLTHILWAGLVCWLIVLLLYVIIIGPTHGGFKLAGVPESSFAPN